MTLLPNTGNEITKQIIIGLYRFALIVVGIKQNWKQRENCNIDVEYYGIIQLQIPLGALTSKCHVSTE